MGRIVFKQSWGKLWVMCYRLDEYIALTVRLKTSKCLIKKVTSPSLPRAVLPSLMNSPTINDFFSVIFFFSLLIQLLKNVEQEHGFRFCSKIGATWWFSFAYFLLISPWKLQLSLVSSLMFLWRCLWIVIGLSRRSGTRSLVFESNEIANSHAARSSLRIIEGFWNNFSVA